MLLLFTFLSALTVLSAPVLLAFHAFLDPELMMSSYIIVVGIWAVLLTVFLAILFRDLRLTLFLVAVSLFSIALAIIASNHNPLASSHKLAINRLQAKPTRRPNVPRVPGGHHSLGQWPSAVAERPMYKPLAAWKAACLGCRCPHNS